LLLLLLLLLLLPLLLLLLAAVVVVVAVPPPPSPASTRRCVRAPRNAPLAPPRAKPRRERGDGAWLVMVMASAAATFEPPVLKHHSDALDSGLDTHLIRRRWC